MNALLIQSEWIRAKSKNPDEVNNPGKEAEEPKRKAIQTIHQFEFELKKDTRQLSTNYETLSTNGEVYVSSRYKIRKDELH